MGSARGLSTEKIEALNDYWTSPLFESKERVALRAADAMTLSSDDVSDELFAQLEQHWTHPEILELFALIAWENASSKFNRALRVPSQKLWDRNSKEAAATAESPPKP